MPLNVWRGFYPRRFMSDFCKLYYCCFVKPFVFGGGRTPALRIKAKNKQKMCRRASNDALRMFSNSYIVFRNNSVFKIEGKISHIIVPTGFFIYGFPLRLCSLIYNARQGAATVERLISNTRDA